MKKVKVNPAKVWATVIHHRHGNDIQVSSTQAIAMQRLYEYCREWWGELDGAGDLPEKDTQDEVIERYFSEAGEWYEAEYYDGPEETAVQ